MGELIKKYGQLHINDKTFDVELNAPIKEDEGGIVHIQSEALRLEMSQLEFYQLAAKVNLAKEQLKQIKGDKLYE